MILVPVGVGKSIKNVMVNNKIHMLEKKYIMLFIVGVVILGTISVGIFMIRPVIFQSADIVTDFDSCVKANGGRIPSIYPPTCTWQGVSYRQSQDDNISSNPDQEDGIHFQQTGIPAEEKDQIDAWIRLNNLNEYGDPKDTVYIGGNPLFSEQSGDSTLLYDYLIKNHPAKPWLKEDIGDNEIQFSDISEWSTYQDPNFEFQYPSFANVASGNGYPIRISSNDGFEMYIVIQSTPPSLGTVCTVMLENVADQDDVYLCFNSEEKYANVYARIMDSFVAK